MGSSLPRGDIHPLFYQTIQLVHKPVDLLGSSVYLLLTMVFSGPIIATASFRTLGKLSGVNTSAKR
jgi:hypothetical protein